MVSISAQILRKEQERGEMRLARARLSVCLIGLIAAVAYYLQAPPAEDVEQFRTTLLMGAGVCYAFIWLVYMSRVRFRRYHRYISSTLDLVVIVGANLIWSMHHEARDFAGQLQFSAGFGSLLILIVLTGLRFDYRTVLYIAGLTFVLYVAYILYGFNLPHYRLTTSWAESFLQPGTLNIRDLLSRLIVIFVVGSLMSYMVFRVGNLLRISVETAAQKDQLRQFVSSNVVTQIEAGRAHLDLSGHRTRVAILFCDIQGFTRISERMPPEELLGMLNRYYEHMAEEIFRFGGTLDKYLGDGIMALFGAPVTLPNCSESAVRSALSMLERIEQFNEQYGYKLKIGIGIHTADVLVGNLGTQTYKNYTAIGDGVNIAARIESATRDADAALLFSRDTYNEIKDVFKTRSAGKFQLKGKSGERVLFTVD